MAKPAQTQTKEPDVIPPDQQVAKRSEGGALSNQVNPALPAFMQQTAQGAGLENIGAQDIETPRIRLLQATSPEVEEFDDARPGVFWNTVAQISLGRELPVVPVYVDQRAILWRPLESGGGILARADDGQTWNPPNATFDVKLKGGKMVKWTTKPTVIASRLLDWGTSDPDDSNSQPAATKMYSIVMATPTFDFLPPSVVTLQRSSIRVAKKFLGQLRLSRAPAFGCKFVMASVREEGPSGAYYNYRFTSAGFVEDEEEFARYEACYKMLKEMGLRLRDVDLDQDDIAAAGADTKADVNAPAY